MFLYFFKEKKLQFDEFHWNSVIWYVKYKSGFSLVRQDLSAKFAGPIWSGEETHMPSPVEPLEKTYHILFNICISVSWWVIAIVVHVVKGVIGQDMASVNDF